MNNLKKSIDNAIAAIDNCLELCEELKKSLQEFMSHDNCDGDHCGHSSTPDL